MNRNANCDQHRYYVRSSPHHLLHGPGGQWYARIELNRLSRSKSKVGDYLESSFAGRSGSNAGRAEIWEETFYHFSGASGRRSITYFPLATLMMGAPGIFLRGLD
jgi:hypothetical protein